MSTLEQRVDALADAAGRDVRELRGGQDDLDRRLTELRNRLAADRAARYEPLPVSEPGAAPQLPDAEEAGVGMNALTGAALDGWGHVEQSIGKILMTRVGARVMFRDFGSDVPKLIDANATLEVIMLFFVAAAEAIDKWEPRFRLTYVSLTEAGRDGRFKFMLDGVYFPRGHLGDYSIAEDRSGAVVLNAA